MQGAYRSYRQPGRQERPSEASPFDGPLGLCWVAPGARFEKEEISGGKSALQTLLHPVALVKEKLLLVLFIARELTTINQVNHVACQLEPYTDMYD